MTDIYCALCGEPWDYWGARHGDMAAWEYDLMRQGSGCPACKGHPPSSPPELRFPEWGDDDPMIALAALEAASAGTAPPWVPPEPIVHWTCSGCGVQVVTDPSEATYDGAKRRDPDPEYRLPSGASGRQWYHSHPYQHGCPEVEPAHKFGEACVCEFCLRLCSECGAPICTLIDHADPYSAGWGSALPDHDWRDVFCIDCIENACSECGQVGCKGECSEADEADDEAEEE